MKKFYVLCTFLCCLLVQQLDAQTRYIDEVFTDADIEVVKDINFGANMSTQSFPPFGADSVPQLQQAFLDVYMPSGAVDTETSRPAVFLIHSENFARFAFACEGAKDDLANVTQAMKWAKMGYVVVTTSGRLGWNPTVNNSNGFIRELSAAVIRRSIDTRTAARWMRKQVAENGNPYSVHPDKFIVTGSNNAGTTVMYTAYKTTDAEFSGPNYIVADENGELRPMYQPEYFGNLQGTEPGFDANGALSNLPSNNGCYSSDFQMAIVMAGVDLDTTFIQAGEAPMVLALAAHQPNLAVEVGTLILPTTQQVCCETFRDNIYMKQANQKGLNDAWKGVTFTSDIANKREVYPPDPSLGEMEGLIIVGEEFPTGNPNPWIYWDKDLCASINPDLNTTRSETFPGNTLEASSAVVNEVIAFAAPRACITLDLGCAGITTGLQEPLVENERIAVSPNPSNDQFTFETPVDKPMESIHIYSITGSLVYKTEVFNSMITLSNLDLANGQYIAKVTFEDGVASKKLTVAE